MVTRAKVGVDVSGIITAVASATIAAGLVGVVVLVLSLTTEIQVGQALQREHIAVEKDAHEKYTAELMNHASRIGVLETRTAVIESLRGKLNLLDDRD